MYDNFQNLKPNRSPLLGSSAVGNGPVPGFKKFSFKNKTLFETDTYGLKPGYRVCWFIIYDS